MSAARQMHVIDRALWAQRADRCGPKDRLSFDLAPGYAQSIESAIADLGVDSDFDFVWTGDDGDTPTRSPGGLTVPIGAGSVVAELSPFKTAVAGVVGGERFDGSTNYRATATAIDPGLTDDMVAVLVARLGPNMALNSAVLGTYIGGAGAEGWSFYASTGGTLKFFWVDSGLSVIALGDALPGAISIAVVAVDRDGDVAGTLDGVSATPDAVTGGSAIGSGLGIGARATGINKAPCGIIAAAFGYGSDIAPKWQADDNALMLQLTNRLRGLKPTLGGEPTYTRSTQRVWYVLNGEDEVAHILGANAPPSGDGEGIASDGEIVSRTDKNYGLLAGDLAGLNAKLDAGLVGALQTETGSDLAALLAALPWASGTVYDISNPTGATLYARLGLALGDDGTSWLSIRARVISGAIAMGWQTAAGAFTEVVSSIATDWARSSGALAPGADTDLQALEIPAGGQVRVILWCAGVGARVEDEVPASTAIGAAQTIAQGAIATDVDPSDVAGAAELAIEPYDDGQTADAPGATAALSVGATTLLTLDPRVDEATVTDGTESPVVVTALEADTEAAVRAAWGAGLLRLAQQDEHEIRSDYDGALHAGVLTARGGAWRLQRLRAWTTRSMGSLAPSQVVAPRGGRLALPSVLRVLAGETLNVVKQSLVIVDPSSYDWTVSADCDLTETAELIQVGSAVAGDYTLDATLSSGGLELASQSITVRVLDDLGGGAPTWGVVIAGDSITAAGTSPSLVEAAGGAHLTMLGLETDDDSTPCEGHSGKQTRWFATEALSPWVDADRVSDIAGYITAIGATPEAVVIHLGTNDAYYAPTDHIDHYVQRSLLYADRLIAAWEAAVPGIEIGICTIGPGSTDQGDFDTSYPPAGTLTIADWRTRQHRLNEALMGHYPTRIIPVHAHVNGDDDYSGNALHPAVAGDDHIAEAIYAWIVERMGA